MSEQSAPSESTSDQLRRLASHELLRGRADRLRTLADDLGDDDRLQRWADVDLFAAFAVSVDDDAPLPDESSTALRWVEAARSVLIFFPLVVTWAGVASAATGYARLIDADADAATTSFLALWEGGFDGHAPLGLTLWRVAMLDVLFIVTLIAATLVAGRLRDRSERALHGEARALRGELASALVDVSLRLSQVRMSSPARFQAELSKSAELMATWHERAVEATEPTAAAAVELSTAGRQVRDAVEEMRTSTATIGQQVADLATQLGELSVTEAGLRDRLDRLLADQEAVLQESARSRESLEQVVAATGDLVVSLEQEAKQTSTTVAAALDESRKVVTLAESAREAQQALTTVIQQMIARLGETTDAIGSVGAKLSAAGSVFETSVASTSEALGRASTALEGAASSEQSVAEHLRRTSASVEAGIVLLRDDLEALSGLVQGLVETFRQIANDAERLRSQETSAA